MVDVDGPGLPQFLQKQPDEKPPGNEKGGLLKGRMMNQKLHPAAEFHRNRISIRGGIFIPMDYFKIIVNVNMGRRAPFNFWVLDSQPG